MITEDLPASLEDVVQEVGVALLHGQRHFYTRPLALEECRWT